MKTKNEHDDINKDQLKQDIETQKRYRDDLDRLTEEEKELGIQDDIEEEGDQFGWAQRLDVDLFELTDGFNERLILLTIDCTFDVKHLSTLLVRNDRIGIHLFDQIYELC